MFICGVPETWISLPMLPLYGKLPFSPFHTGRPVHVSVSEMTDWWYFSRIKKCQPRSFLSCMFTFYSCFCLSFVDQWKLLIVTWAKKKLVCIPYIFVLLEQLNCMYFKLVQSGHFNSDNINAFKCQCHCQYLGCIMCFTFKVNLFSHKLVFTKD